MQYYKCKIYLFTFIYLIGLNQQMINSLGVDMKGILKYEKYISKTLSNFLYYCLCLHLSPSPHLLPVLAQAPHRYSGGAFGSSGVIPLLPGA